MNDNEIDSNTPPEDYNILRRQSHVLSTNYDRVYNEHLIPPNITIMKNYEVSKNKSLNFH